MQNQFRILIVDDVEEMRELMAFVLQSFFPAHCEVDISGNRAQERLEKDPFFHLIISDFNMPNGNGEDLFKYLLKKNLKIPFVILSGNDLEGNPVFNKSHVLRMKKPFTPKELIEVVRPHVSEIENQSTYLPVGIDLLKLVGKIHTPLFVKIGDRYVKITHGEIDFSADEHSKYAQKNVSHLFIERAHADKFITEFQKKTMTQQAWNEVSPEDLPHHLKLNIDFIKHFSQEFNLKQELVEKVAQNIQKSLAILTKSSTLKGLLSRFQGIEHFGHSDHCTLTSLIASGIASEVKAPWVDADTLQKLSFVSLLHDLSLSEPEYTHKKKWLSHMHYGIELNTQELKNIYHHPSKSAELCKSWEFVPPDVTAIIQDHHENPEGTGFPNGKKPHEVHPLSALFFVAQDFTEFYIESSGEPEMEFYLKNRASRFTMEPYLTSFLALKKSLNN